MKKSGQDSDIIIMKTRKGIPDGQKTVQGKRNPIKGYLMDRKQSEERRNDLC